MLECMAVTPLLPLCLSVSVIHSQSFFFLSASLYLFLLCFLFSSSLCASVKFVSLWHTADPLARPAAIMGGRHTDNNAGPCGLHCVNWLELVLLCPRAVFDVNMLEAWLSFVVIRLSAQRENSH